MVADFLDQRYGRGARVESVPQLTVVLRMGKLSSLATEPSADRTSVWKGCAVPGIVKNKHAFVFGSKGRCVLANLVWRLGRRDSSWGSLLTLDLRLIGWRCTTAVAGTGGRGMIEMAKMSMTPVANRPWE